MQHLKYQLYNISAILLQQFEKTPISWISQEPMAGKKRLNIYVQYVSDLLDVTILFFWTINMKFK